MSLFHLGFEVDERVEERFQELKHSGRAPLDALPGLREVLEEPWSPSHFALWVEAHPSAETTQAYAGLQLRGAPPDALERLVDHLVGALAPLSPTWPLPHYRMKE